MSLWRRWKAEGFVYCCLLAICISLPVVSVLYAFLLWPYWSGGLVMIASLLAAFFLFPYWRMGPGDAVRYLDGRVPELEESCGLLLRSVDELGPLQQLQVARTEARLAGLRAPHPMRARLLWAAGGVVVAFLFSYAILFNAPGKRMIEVAVEQKAPPPVPPPPGVRSVRIRVSPPAYTGRAVRRQEQFNLRVEEGSLVEWELGTSGKVQRVEIIINDSIRVSLQAANAEKTSWRLAWRATRPGYYQVDVGGKLSELYTLEVIKDEPPRIVITHPKSYTVVDIGEVMKISLAVSLQDDYGIADAAVHATVSSGNGEAVKFKEQTIRFNRVFRGDQTSAALQQVLDLAALGMKSGDELYFYCGAKDNHGQESRTDMYIVSLPDTAQLMSLEGLTMGVNSKPEYFRSERQIIIETEQILKEKDTLAAEVFKQRSNELGIDQKLLRLRYGKFLGEEAEEGGVGSEAPGRPGGGIGGAGGVGETGKAGDLRRPGDFGDAATILDAYTDKHDNAEDATYFEPAVKEQLKATLSEMWKAELRLRTYKAREALPFAYKALRLLKDLQQKSRAYVAKTGVRVTPLDPARRLGGKLDAIAPSVQRDGERRDPMSDPDDAMRIALALLERVGEAGGDGSAELRVMGAGSLAMLQQAAQRLGREASVRPGVYLAGYQAMRRIMGKESETGKRGLTDDVLSAQKAIQWLLPVSEATPVAGKTAADGGLSGLYFKNINDRGGKP
jgi:hypothetical protein